MTPTNTCLDAETLATWVEGGLRSNDAAMAEAHVSSCPRCQEIAGLIVKTTPVGPVDLPWWRARAAWLVPATAMAAAVGLWIIAPTEPAPDHAPPIAMARLESAPPAVAPAAPAVAPPAAAAEPAAQQPGQPQDSEQKKVLADRSRALDTVKAPQVRAERPEQQRPERGANPAAPAPAGPPAAASERIVAEQAARPGFAAAGAKEAVSPDGALRWQITDRGALERSTDGGTTWQPVNVGVTATFTTVQAPEPRSAIVTTPDGRQFRTTDAGATWQPVPK